MQHWKHYVQVRHAQSVLSQEVYHPAGVARPLM